MIGISLFVFSCSSEDSIEKEQDALTNDTPSQSQAYRLGQTDLAVAQQMYLDMMRTQEYIDFKAASANFRSKFNGNEITFKTRQDGVDWITNNLGKTSFTSVTEFETIFDEAVAKTNAWINANPTLFDFIKAADKEERMIIFKPEEGDGSLPDYNGTVTTQSCMDDCVNAYETAYDEATDEYYDSIGEPDGSIGYAILTFLNITDYENTIYETLPLAYNNCMSAC